MLAVSNVDPERLAVIVAELAEGQTAERAAVLAIRNGRRRVVLSGPPAQLARVQQRCEQIAADGPVNAMPRPVVAQSSRLSSSRSRSRSASNTPRWPRPSTSSVVGPPLWSRRRPGARARAGRPRRPGRLGRRRRRRRRVRRSLDPGPRTRRSAHPHDVRGLRGHGVGILAASHPRWPPQPAHPGATPEVARAWTEFAPKAVTLPDGRVAVETAFTKLTGRSPILLAGMTPPTVDPAIVAAARTPATGPSSPVAARSQSRSSPTTSRA